MTASGWALILVFIAVLAALTKPMGMWLFALYEGRSTPLHRLLGPVERSFYKLSGIDPNEEQSWRRYALHMLLFNLALFGTSLTLVGLAVWFALRFADRQVKPLADLVTAAREVGAGNYALRVGGRTGPDEIGLLNRAFNRMTEQIERQTDALIGANRQLAERRAFMEAVLQSITAGIISVDDEGQVALMNDPATSHPFYWAGFVLVGDGAQPVIRAK